MFFVLACSLLATARPAEALLRSHVDRQVAEAKDRPEGAFREWAELHEKVYASDEERALRFSIWRDNLDYIDRYNSQQDSHWLGLNIHADLTNEEFSSQWLGFDREAANARPRNPVSLEVSLDDLPTSVDWNKKGAVTNVKNQEQCGSCWAFSTTGAVEGINQISTGDLISLSEQELVDCDVAVDSGCKGGLMDHAFAWIIQNGGIDTENDYKYHAKQGQCNVGRENRHVVTIDSYHDVPTNSPGALLKAAAQQPVSVAIQSNQLNFQLYSGGVLTGTCGTAVDHGVLLVGYGTDVDGEKKTDYWTVKNSWGPNWGEDGYVRMFRNMTEGSPGMCGISLIASYPVKTHDNPPKPPPPAPTPAPSPAPAPKPSPFVKCDDFVACQPKTTCCCGLELYGQCFQWACCPMPRATCCDDHVHCCPESAPVCDTDSSRCMPKGRSGLLGALTAGVPMAEKVPAFVLGESDLAGKLKQV